MGELELKIEKVLFKDCEIEIKIGIVGFKDWKLIGIIEIGNYRYIYCIFYFGIK